LATGALALVYHLSRFKPRNPFAYDGTWASLVGLLALVAGAYMLRAANWARWLAIAWIAFHVVLSAFHSVSQLLFHALLCAVFAYFLFRPPANEYFSAAP
jgi:hypothetical protein